MDLCLAFSFTAPILFLGAGGGEITLKCSSSSNSNAIRSLVPSKHGRCLIMMLPCGWFCGFFRVWPFHLWRSCLYFHCSSSLSNSLTAGILCYVRFPSWADSLLKMKPGWYFSFMCFQFNPCPTASVKPASRIMYCRMSSSGILNKKSEASEIWRFEKLPK